MTALVAYIEGVGLLGPGLPNWTVGAPIFAGCVPLVYAPTILPTAHALPAAERRRTGEVVKLALAIGYEAAGHAACDLSALTTVFSSSGGDGHNCHEICQTLASTDRQVSPTRFHNSVHNAAAGYWSIATASKAPSTVLCAYDASFTAGLLETMTHVTVLQVAAMLIAYDVGYPAPLHAKRPMEQPFGVALVVSPKVGERSLAKVEVALADSRVDGLDDSSLERLRKGVPAGRSLPLLRLLARRQAGVVHLEYLDRIAVRAQITPC